MNFQRINLFNRHINSGLTVFYATLCIIDIFGVFPIIALPRAIVQCGLLGIPLVIVVFLLQIYTSALLGESWIIASTLDPQIARKNRHPLAAVTELTLGSKARTAISILLDLTVFGCGIPNLLVASQNLQLFGLKVSDDKFDISFCYWLLAIGVLLCPLMWLGSPRDMKSLAIFSTGSVVVTAILIWWCIITDINPKYTPIPTSPGWDKFISGYAMLAFQFDVHPTLMTIQVDMKNPRKINQAVILSFLFSGGLFGITAFLAAWKYGGGTTANILQLAPAGDASRAAILLAALQLIFSSVIGHAALFLHLEDELHVQRSFGWKRCAVRSAVVVLGVAIGESVPRFDIVMALIGGTLTGPLVFILPPIIYSRARALKIKFDTNNSTPDILSTERQVKVLYNIEHPKAHSASTYYGLSDNDKSQNRYTYIYYNKNEDVDEDDDDDAGLLDSDLSQERVDSTSELVGENIPLLIDATKPDKFRRKKIIKIELPRKTLFYQYLFNWFSYFVVLTGIIITISSTYINVKNTIKFVKFTPPCIINASSV